MGRQSCGFDQHFIVTEWSHRLGGDVPPGSRPQVAVTRWGRSCRFSQRNQIVDLVSASCSENDLQGPTGGRRHGAESPAGSSAPLACPLVIYLLYRVLIIIACCIFPGIRWTDRLKVRGCGLQLLAAHQRAEPILPGREFDFSVGAGSKAWPIWWFIFNAYYFECLYCSMSIIIIWFFFK